MSLTNKIIVLCVIVYFGSTILTSLNIIPFEFVSDNFFYSLNKALTGNVYVLVTALFMHGSLTHLLTNLMLLYIVGNTLEEIGGPKKFALVFFLGGIVTFILSSPAYGYSDLMAGNSGAVFTVMAVVAIVNPLAYTKSLPYRFVFGSGKEVASEVSERVFDRKNFVIIALILVLVQFTIIMLYTTIVPDESVGHLGHFIGFLIGMIFGVAWSERLQQVIRRTGSFFVLGFFLIIFLTYSFYVVLRIVNPGSTNFIDDFLLAFDIRLFSSEAVKCNNYCLERNYDYGVVEGGFCDCEVNLTIPERIS